MSSSLASRPSCAAHPVRCNSAEADALPQCGLPVAAGRSTALLLVEDNLAFAELVAAILGANGYRVRWAPTAGAARRWLEAVRPALILPDGDGRWSWLPTQTASGW